MGVKQEMEITISKRGEVQVHVKGVPGPRCMKLSEFLTKALGQVVKVEKTSEYYQSDKSEVRSTNIDLSSAKGGTD